MTFCFEGTILQQSLSPKQAAILLGVSDGRVHQRLIREKSLYGIKLGNKWKIPMFQFYDGREVPGISKVIPKISRNLHPLTVISWFNVPNLNLLSKIDSVALSPLCWLKSGNDPLVVAELASDL